MTLDIDDQSIRNYDQNDTSEVQHMIQNAIQTWIALAYLQIVQQYESSASNISSSKVTTLQQWLEITTVSIKNVHIRLEHSYTCHIPSGPKVR